LGGVTLGDCAAVFKEMDGRDGFGMAWWHPISRNRIASGKCSSCRQFPSVAPQETEELL